MTVEGIRKLIEAVAENDGKASALKDAISQIENCVQTCTVTQNRMIKEGVDISEIRDSYEEVIVQYNEIRNECQLIIGSTLSKPKLLTTCGTNIRMQKLNFEVFSGDLRKYPQFKDEFKRYIKPLYTDDDEGFVLRSYLSSSLKDEIYNLGDDIKAIWARLD